MLKDVERSKAPANYVMKSNLNITFLVALDQGEKSCKNPTEVHSLDYWNGW